MAEAKKRWFDRRDGKRIKDLDGVHYMMPYLMPKRCDSEVYIQEKIDVTEVLKFVASKNGPDAPYKTTAFHVFAAAVAKIVIHRPLLNRFIVNKHIYEREKVSLSFMAKRTFSDHSEEVLVKAIADGDTVLSDISKRVVGDVTKLRKGGTNDIDEALNFLKKMPRFLMSFIMMIFRFLDKYDWMPNSLKDGDTNYSSVLLSNLGSIKCGAPYHHLNEYGTNSIVATIGVIHKEPVYADDGSFEIRDVVDFGITLDERIADGFYFAKSVKLLKYILAHPEMLDKPFKEEVNYDI